MKKLLSLFCVLMMTATASGGWVSAAEDIAEETTASYESLFEKDKVIDIQIELSEEDLESIYANPELEEYHTANVTVDGVTVDDVGIRTKGNSSLKSVAKSDSDRYSFRIKFDKYNKDQSLLGLDELVVNNMYSDASYMREYLSYEAMREMGLDAPLAVFANIYINGELKGFYLCVEAIENAFLERSFGNDDGNLYKQEQGSTLAYQEGSEYQSSELKVGEDTEKTGLKQMIQQLKEGTDLDSVLDIDSALKYIAANTVLGSYDSYSGQFAQNYYLYEQDGKFTVIPWDYNMSFGGFGQGGNGWSVSLDSPVSGVSMESRPLISKLLAVQEYKEQYLQYVKEFSAYLENMQTRVDELAAIIRPYVEADPTKFVTTEQFENSIIYVEETERTGNIGGGRQGGMPNEANGQMPDGTNMETMQKAMEIIKATGTNDLTEDQQKQLTDLGLTEEQITRMKSMGQKGGMGGGQRAGMTPPSESEGNTRGNGQMPQGMNEPGTQAETDGTTQIRPQGGMQNGNMGMGGGSIITFATKRLANINTQLYGDTATDSQISVLLKGSKLNFDVAPMIENDRTLVPVRAIFEALGMTVDYEDGQITATKDGLTILLTIDSKIASINDEQVALDVASKIVSDRTLVPLRFIGEATGLTVTYDDNTKTITMEEADGNS